MLIVVLVHISNGSGGFVERLRAVADGLDERVIPFTSLCRMRTEIGVYFRIRGAEGRLLWLVFSCEISLLFGLQSAKELGSVTIKLRNRWRLDSSPDQRDKFISSFFIISTCG